MRFNPIFEYHEPFERRKKKYNELCINVVPVTRFVRFEMIMKFLKYYYPYEIPIVKENPGGGMFIKTDTKTITVVLI